MTTTTIHAGNSATLELLAGYVLTVTADEDASSNCAVKRSRIFAAIDETVVTTETTFGPYLASMTMVINCDVGNVSFSAAVSTDSLAPGADVGFANPMTTAGDTIIGGVAGAAARQAKVLTTAGDLLVAGASGVWTRLPKGTDGQVLTMVSGAVAWV